jgi:hypothetical protein
MNETATSTVSSTVDTIQKNLSSMDTASVDHTILNMPHHITLTDVSNLVISATYYTTMSVVIGGGTIIVIKLYTTAVTTGSILGAI